MQVIPEATSKEAHDTREAAHGGLLRWADECIFSICQADRMSWDSVIFCPYACPLEGLHSYIHIYRYMYNIFIYIHIYIYLFTQTKQFQNIYIYIYTHLFGAHPVRKSLKAIQLRQRCRNKGQWTHSKFFQTPS